MKQTNSLVTVQRTHFTMKSSSSKPLASKISSMCERPCEAKNWLSFSVILSSANTVNAIHCHIIKSSTNPISDDASWIEILKSNNFSFSSSACHKSTAVSTGKKREVLPYSLLSVRPRADHSVQAVSQQVTFCHLLAVGCHYFLPGLWLPSQPKNVTVLRPVPNCTAWRERHIGVNNLPKVVIQLYPSGD